jgi:hypothetical protein
MSTKKIDHNEEGEDLTAPDPQSNAGQLIYFLEWARQRDFHVGPTLQFGDVIVQVQDKREKTTSREPDTDIYQEHGYTEKT